MKTNRRSSRAPEAPQEAAGLREAHVVLTALRGWLDKQERSLDGAARWSRDELAIFRVLMERAD